MTNSEPEHKLSRRGFLGAAAGVAGTVGMGTVLSACGGSSSGSSTASVLPAGKPKPGGTLTVGWIGGSSSDTIDGFNPITQIDYGRVPALFEQLVRWEPGGVQNKLAEEFSSNADGTVWTVRVRSGLTFHNGKPVTAEDLIFSFQHMLNVKTPTIGTAAMVAVDPHGLKKLDARTIQVAMTSPQTTFRDQMSNTTFPIVPVGYDPKHPIGCGPFKLDSFSPGQRSVMSRFPDYYLSPMPYFDSLIIEDFPSSTSQINALSSGQINAAAGIPWISARELQSQSGVKVINEHSGQWLEYEMRTDPGQPFSDVRVRQAIRLLIDRTQFISNVYDGQAIIGNDLFSRFDPNYDSSLPQREPDPDKAKSLLKAAGAADSTFTMISGPWIPGLLEGAELISQQASAAGVKLTVRNTPIGQFVAQDYLKAPMACGYWFDLPYAAQCIITMTKSAGQNESHWGNSSWDALWLQLNRTSEPAKYRDIIHQMQTIEWNEGGYIIPGFYNSVDAVAPDVQGLAVQNTKGPLGGPHFERGWIS
jgi:peptide/nickel transport system substrate-binding protein